MLAFWIAAALLSAAVAILIPLRAARAAAVEPAEDPTLAVYRRQIAELDDLVARGLLPQAERRSARTEAARRLLAAADKTRAPPADSLKSRRAVFIVAAAAPLVALAAYLAVGSPETPDQPYAKRLAAWASTASHAGTESQLTSPELAAVLRSVVARRPGDPVALVYLAHADVDSGDPAAGEQDLRRAIMLDPRNAQIWELLGETLAMQTDDEASPDARGAFEHALALDPKLAPARYYVGRAKLASGDANGGLADWRALLAALPAGDPSRASLQSQIAAVEKTGALPTQAAPSGADQQAMIHAMVAGLAARLKAHPDDPEGWGRLLRSYAVLGDASGHAAALVQARAEFKDRPAAWARVERAETSAQ